MVNVLRKKPGIIFLLLFYVQRVAKLLQNIDDLYRLIKSRWRSGYNVCSFSFLSIGNNLDFVTAVNHDELTITVGAFSSFIDTYLSSSMLIRCHIVGENLLHGHLIFCSILDYRCQLIQTKVRFHHHHHRQLQRRWMWIIIHRYNCIN